MVVRLFLVAKQRGSAEHVSLFDGPRDVGDFTTHVVACRQVLNNMGLRGYWPGGAVHQNTPCPCPVLVFIYIFLCLVLIKWLLSPSMSRSRVRSMLCSQKKKRGFSVHQNQPLTQPIIGKTRSTFKKHAREEWPKLKCENWKLIKFS